MKNKSYIIIQSFILKQRFTFFLLIFFAFSVCSRATTYICSNFTDFTNYLPIAISDVNAGTSSTIKINSMITVPTSFTIPTISLSVNTTATLSIINNNSPANTDGFVGSSFSGTPYFLQIEALGGSVIIKGLKFQDFSQAGGCYDPSVIYNVAGNFKCDHNHFVNCHNNSSTCYYPINYMVTGTLLCISSKSGDNINIIDNTFYDCDNGLYFDFEQVNSSQENIIVQNNSFNLINYDVIQVKCVEALTNTEIVIDNNHIGTCDRAFVIMDWSETMYTTPLFYPHITNNDVQYCTYSVFYFYAPLKSWEIVNNSVTGYSCGSCTGYPYFLYIQSPTDFPYPYNDIYGFNFISNTNTLGYTPTNDYNTFNGNVSSGHPIAFCPGYFGQGGYFIGLEFSESLLFYSGSSGSPYNNITVRECRIHASSQDEPLMYSDFQNKFPSFYFGDLTFCDNQLAGKLNVGSPYLDISYGNYVADLYVSNANGDLLDYIGNFPITTFNTTPYPFSIAVPPGITINSNTRIAGTVTSLADLPGSYCIGTSRAFYPITDGIGACCCTSLSITGPGTTSGNYIFGCDETDLTFEGACLDGDGSAAFSWDIFQGSTSIDHETGSTLVYSFDDPGFYTLTLSATSANCTTTTLDQDIYISDCDDPECSDCIPSFSPVPGKTYIVSAWTKEEPGNDIKITYDFPELDVELFSGQDPTYTSLQLYQCYPAGKIIDGWQRIEQEIYVPLDQDPNLTATYLTITLKSLSSFVPVYFDDLRIYPKDGSMKSFVYNPVNLRFVAELDERNYASFFEYDEEGKLIRAKKETERGIMMVKENRSHVANKHQ